MREMFILNLNWFMQTLLARKDNMSMASSLEVRVPFCDYRLVEYAYNMPWDIKALAGREKAFCAKHLKTICRMKLRGVKKPLSENSQSCLFCKGERTSYHRFNRQFNPD